MVMDSCMPTCHRSKLKTSTSNRRGERVANSYESTQTFIVIFLSEDATDCVGLVFVGSCCKPGEWTGTNSEWISLCVSGSDHFTPTSKLRTRNFKFLFIFLNSQLVMMIRTTSSSWQQQHYPQGKQRHDYRKWRYQHSSLSSRAKW